MTKILIDPEIAATDMPAAYDHGSGAPLPGMVVLFTDGRVVVTKEASRNLPREGVEFAWQVDHFVSGRALAKCLIDHMDDLIGLIETPPGEGMIESYFTPTWRRIGLAFNKLPAGRGFLAA